jgi:DNA-binding HxlR family transcriptional regulator
MADATSASEPTCDVDGTCYCPLTGVIDTLSRKYAMQLVSIIGAHDSLRFAEIEDHLASASTSTISKRLDEFEEAELVSRTQYDEIPPRVEYALTEEGHEVRERLEPLLEWVSETDDDPSKSDLRT